MDQDVTNLEEMLDRIAEVAQEHPRVSLEMILEAVGRRSFGPFLMLVGLILFSPLSGIPGMPTTMGICILLIVGQILLRRRSFWLPAFLLRRSLPRRRALRVVRRSRPIARRVDGWLRPRFRIFVNGWGTYSIALLSAVIAAVMPLMEVVPFSATIAGLALAIFGLSLIAQDGLLAAIAFLITSCILLLAARNLLGI